VFVLTVTTQSVPWVKDSERLIVKELAPGFWRAAARYGFMERPDIPALLRQAHEGGCAIDLSDVTYYVGHETVVPGDDEKALPRVVEALFAFMPLHIRRRIRSAAGKRDDVILDEAGACAGRAPRRGAGMLPLKFVLHL
jgi:K+ transporter